MKLNAKQISDLRKAAKDEYNRRFSQFVKPTESLMPWIEVVRAAEQCDTTEEAINKLCRDNAPRA